MSESHDDRVLLDALAAPGLEVARVAERVKHKPELVEAVIAGVGSDKARVKFGAGKVLRVLSEQAPELVYPHFDFFVRLLAHENSILKWNATLVLGNLAVVDRERKLDRILDAYLAPISGPKLIDATKVIRGAAAIALAKPYLADPIAQRILRVERATYRTPECRNVALGHAIRALEQFFAATDDKRSIQLFVSRQTGNSRPATRSKAQKFLQKWPLARPHRSVRGKAA
jgi:hypothetical protein